MYRSILLTIDGSPLSRAAIPHAGLLAAGGDTHVHVVQVIPTVETLQVEAMGAYEEIGGSQEAQEQWARTAHFMARNNALAEVASAQSQLEAAGVRSVTTSVLEGLAGNEIVDYAQRESCQAIVMGTRGHSGLGREVAGSVAEYVIRHAGDAAVVLVGPRTKVS